MSKGIIGIDIDNVTCNTSSAIIDYYNKLSGDNLKLSDINEYYIENFVLPEWKDKFHKLFMDKKFWKTVNIIEDCQYYINKLIENGYRIVFITSTEPYNYYKKSKWLSRMFPNIDLRDSLISIKDKQLMSTYIDYLVDDYNKNLEDKFDNYGNFLEAKYRKIIFNCNDTYNWTKNFVCDGVNSFMALNWKQVYEIILRGSDND